MSESSRKEFEETKRHSLSSGRSTLPLKIRGNQPNIYPKILLLPWRTGLSNQFTPMSAERSSAFFEKGFKAPLACNETITMRHDVMRAIFPGLPSDLHGTPYPTSEEELVTAGHSYSLRKCLIVTGGGSCVNSPVNLKLFLGKWPAFLDEQGRKTSSRPV